jgi:MFS transporter, FSR family, fosmidomycin resistance protein
MRSFLNRVVFAAALGHFVVDLNANLLPVMLPFLRESLSLSYAQTGLIMTSFSMTSSLAQPLFGHLADKLGGRVLLILPVAWMALFMGLAGTATTYPAILALVTFAGIGSAAFHPQGAAAARRAVTGRHAATAVSVYSLGGTAGYALGPLVAAGLFLSLGLGGSAALIPFGLIGTGVIAWAVLGKSGGLATVAHRAIGDGPTRVPWLMLVGLLVVVVMRGWVEYGVVAYTPLRFQGDVTLSSRVLFAFLIGEAFGTFSGAMAADRFGRRAVIVVVSLLLVPAIVGFNLANGPLLFAVAPFSGLLIGATMPVTIVMAQELLPRNIGMASGLMMGFAFGVAGLGVAINGVVADTYGLPTSMMLLAALPIVSAVVAAVLPPALEARERVAAS